MIELWGIYLKEKTQLFQQFIIRIIVQSFSIYDPQSEYTFQLALTLRHVKLCSLIIALMICRPTQTHYADQPAWSSHRES